VLTRGSGWCDEATEHFGGDRLVLRQGCRVDWEAGPATTPQRRGANLSDLAPLARRDDPVVG